MFFIGSPLHDYKVNELANNMFLTALTSQSEAWSHNKNTKGAEFPAKMKNALFQSYISQASDHDSSVSIEFKQREGWSLQYFKVTV